MNGIRRAIEGARARGLRYRSAAAWARGPRTERTADRPRRATTFGGRLTPAVAMAIVMMLAVAGGALAVATGEQTPALRPDLGSGVVWLPTSTRSVVTAVDVASARPVAEIALTGAAASKRGQANSTIATSVQQRQAVIYQPDLGVLTRVSTDTVSAATPLAVRRKGFEPSIVLAGAAGTVLVDARRGLVSTMGRRGVIASPARLAAAVTSSDVDSDGVVWLASASLGTVVAVGRGGLTPPARVCSSNDCVLVGVAGRTQAVDAGTGRVTQLAYRSSRTLPATSPGPAVPGGPKGIELPAGRDLAVGGSSLPRLVALSPDTSTLTVVGPGLTPRLVPSPVQASHRVGALVAVGDRVVLTDDTDGSAVVVDTQTGKVTRLELPRSAALTLVRSAGDVVVNDPGSERGVVVTADSITAFSKLDPAVAAEAIQPGQAQPAPVAAPLGASPSATPTGSRASTPTQPSSSGTPAAAHPTSAPSTVPSLGVTPAPGSIRVSSSPARSTKPEAPGPPRTGPPTGQPATSAPNTGPPNAGSPNAGSPNAGSPNAGPPNSGPPNGGPPNGPDPKPTPTPTPTPPTLPAPAPAPGPTTVRTQPLLGSGSGTGTDLALRLSYQVSGGGPVTGWQLNVFDEAGAQVAATTAPASSTSVDVALPGCGRYSAEATAIGPGGSTRSARSTPVLVCGALGQVTGVTAVALNANQANVRWRPPAGDGLSTRVHFDDGAGHAFTLDPGSATSTDVSGLRALTGYQVTITVTDRWGRSATAGTTVLTLPEAVGICAQRIAAVGVKLPLPYNTWATCAGKADFKVFAEPSPTVGIDLRLQLFSSPSTGAVDGVEYRLAVTGADGTVYDDLGALEPGFTPGPVLGYVSRVPVAPTTGYVTAWDVAPLLTSRILWRYTAGPAPDLSGYQASITERGRVVGAT